MKVNMLSKVVNTTKAVAKDYKEYYKTANDAANKFKKSHPVVSAVGTIATFVAGAYLSNPDFWNETISDGIDSIKEKFNEVKKEKEIDAMKATHPEYFKYISGMNLKSLYHELDMLDSVISLYRIKLSRTDDPIDIEVINECITRNTSKYECALYYATHVIEDLQSLNNDEYHISSSGSSYDNCELYRDYTNSTVQEYTTYLHTLSKQKLIKERNNLEIAFHMMREALFGPFHDSIVSIGEEKNNDNNERILHELADRKDMINIELRKITRKENQDKIRDFNASYGKRFNK